VAQPLDNRSNNNDDVEVGAYKIGRMWAELGHRSNE